MVFLLKQVCECTCLVVRERRNEENEKDLICREAKHFFQNLWRMKSETRKHTVDEANHGTAGIATIHLADFDRYRTA